MTKKSGNQANQRGSARLAAVQALYQMDVGRASLEATMGEFIAGRLGQETEGDHYLPADADYFGQILKGVTSRQLSIDPMIDQSLVEGWPVERIDSTLRAILRAGTFELMAKADVPASVVISEYVEVAKAFFEDEAPKLVNAVLDRVAQQVRPIRTKEKSGD